MMFSASSSDLVRAVQAVAGAISTKGALPILECILFERAGDQLRLSATDLEISIVEQVPVAFDSGDADMSRVAVPARRLLDTLRSLPDLPVQFACDADRGITIRTDQGRFKMVGQDGVDFPAIPRVEADTMIETTGGDLRKAISLTSFAVSRDALRPAMMGVYVQVGPSGSRFVSTDGHRLVRYSLKDIESSTEQRFIIPEKALALVAKTAGDRDCDVSMESGYVAFRMGPTVIMARLIDETYPNYEAVIPSQNDKTATLLREPFLAALKRVSLYSSSTTNQVRLSFSGGGVAISAEDVERASEAKETLPCSFDGADLTIGFNSAYLSELVQHVDHDEVKMTFSTPNRAGIISPAEQDATEDLLMLIMPVMLPAA